MSSLYGSDAGYTIKDIVDTEIIQAGVKESLEGRFIENAIFTKAPNNNGYLRYTQDQLTTFTDPKPVAEFAEIPVVSGGEDRVKVALPVKTAQALRVSYEMMQANDLTRLSQDVKKLQETFTVASINGALTAVKSAGLTEVQADAKWTEESAEPLKDVEKAVLKVLDGIEEDKPSYEPDTILIHKANAARLLYSRGLQEKYVGDLASDNPIFEDYKGAEKRTFYGMTVIASHHVPRDSALIFNRGNLGIVSDFISFTLSPFYSEGGPENIETYGPHMSKRCDAVHSRVMQVVNPTAGIWIKGLK